MELFRYFFHPSEHTSVSHLQKISNHQFLKIIIITKDFKYLKKLDKLRHLSKQAVSESNFSESYHEKCHILIVSEKPGNIILFYLKWSFSNFPTWNFSQLCDSL